MEPEAAWTLWEMEETTDYADHNSVTVPTELTRLEHCSSASINCSALWMLETYVCLFLPCEFCIQN